MSIENSFRSGISRYAFAFVLAVLPLQASALDLTPDASRIISDPAYLPLQGQIYGSSQYSYSRTTSNTNNYLGAPKSSNTTTTNGLNQVIAYGVTDDFTLRMSDSYDWRTSDSNPTSGAGTQSSSNGFSDPAFGATWRVIDQKTYPISWDLIGSYAPDLINAKSASPTQDGTIARGGATATAGTALSYETKDFTVYGEGSATYLGSRDTLNQTSGITTNYDSSWQYALALNTQTRLTDLVSVNAGVTETFNNSADASFISGGSLTSFTSEPGDVTELNAALNFQVIPDRLVASVVYAHYFYDNSSNNYAALPHSDTTVRDESEDSVTANLRYILN